MIEKAAATDFIDTLVPTNADIHFISDKPLASDLLVEFMGAKIEVPCHSSTADSLAAFLKRFPGRTQLAFFDSHGVKRSILFKAADSIKTLHHPHFYPILYNVEQLTPPIEMDALQHGVRGILYAHQSPEIFLRAARALLDGELWFSRKVLAEFIDKNISRLNPLEEACARMTNREKEILLKLAEGFKNDEIARHLNISSHTVRNHVYNIYKKIKVDSRLKAALWIHNRTF
jgi:LuxR family transcriptional regulator of csgAB operon